MKIIHVAREQHCSVPYHTGVLYCVLEKTLVFPSGHFSGIAGLLYRRAELSSGINWYRCYLLQWQKKFISIKVVGSAQSYYM